MLNISENHIEAHRLATLPLENGVVVVVGAYKGATIQFLLEHYKDITIYAFEPQTWAALQIPMIEDRVKIYNYALGQENGQAALYESGTDTASLLRLEKYRTKAFVDVRDARQVFGTLGLTKIDLFFMNVEGSEYDLIPYLIDYGLPVERWLVQFHFIEKFTEKFAAIRERMYSSHSLGDGWWLLT